MSILAFVLTWNSIKFGGEGVQDNPVLSLPENNNRSETLELLSNEALSFSFLIETKIYNQKLKSKALKCFQALAFPKVTEQG